MLHGQLAQGLVLHYSLSLCVKERVLTQMTSKLPSSSNILSFYEEPVR